MSNTFHEATVVAPTTAGHPAQQQSRKRTQPATFATLAAAAVAGVFFDVMVRHQVASIGGAMFFAVVAVALYATSKGPVNRASMVCFGGAVVFGIAMAVRASEGLITFDFLAAVLLLWTGAYAVRSGSPMGLTPGVVVDRGLRVLTHGVMAFSFLWQPIATAVLRGRGQRAQAVVRGVMLIAPVLIVLAVLLGSADAVFASLFSFHFEPGPVTGHLAVIALGAWLVAILLRIAATKADDPQPTHAFKIGAVEGLVALSCLVLLFAAFVGSQIVVWAGGADHVLQTAGLTYADHARAGFFQLLAVAAITLGVLRAMRARTALASPVQAQWFRLLSLTAIVLTLVIVGVALRRLGMYEHVFGLTMLRLYASVFALWIGAVFMLAAVSVVRQDAGQWFLGAATGVGLAFLLVLNVANPEAFVVNRNVQRVQANATVPFDVFYAATLSADATPALVDALDSFHPELQEDLLTWLCSRPGTLHNDGGFSANVSKIRADNAIDTVCPHE